MSELLDESLPALSADEAARYEWQTRTAGVGETGQRKLKAASVLISRVGGVGGAVAYYLAAAGVGRLVLAHAGDVAPADLSRQILMTHDWLGRPRVESARRRLKELNPHVEVETIEQNVTPANAAGMVARADLIVDAAPLFEERLAMNQAAVRQRKPMVDCAMFDFDAQLTTIVPGQTPCLACLCPTPPATWKRQFPVFGAVAAVVGGLGAVEAIKLITGVGEPLAGRMLLADLREMRFRTVTVNRNPNCTVCGDLR
jgi:molybdopterin/thiamine biosynthesis adenylyltransferase